MNKIYIDIETTPSQDPKVKEGIAATIQPPGNISKAETIATWMADKKPSAIDESWRKTALDGAHGHICVIGMAIDDGDPIALFSNDWHQKEADILREFYGYVDAICKKHPNVRPTFIGHNLLEFDFKFLFQRSVVLNVKPSIHIPFSAKPWDESVYDTMLRWGARVGGSLDKITRAIGLEGKGEIDGSMVWDYVQSGRIAEVAEYCKHDISLTRSLYKRMTFAEAA